MADERIEDITIEVEEFPEDCSIEMRRFFVLLAAAAVLILFASYWYVEYYSKGVNIDRVSMHRQTSASAQQGGVAAAPVNGGAMAVQPLVANTMPVAATPVPNMGYQGSFPTTGPGSAQMIPEPMLPQGQYTPVAAMNLPHVQAAPDINISPELNVAQPMQVRGPFPSVVNRVSDTVVHVKVQTIVRPGGAAMNQGGIAFASPVNPNAMPTAGNVVGSGVIISRDGYILTNYHVVRDASSLSVVVFTPQGAREYPAMIVKMSEKTDLALLRINADVPLKVAVLGDSDKLRVADAVIAIGSPFGLGQTVSQGIISAVRKTLMIEGVSHEGLLQTDAAINQGNSGGPLFDHNGEVIGINTAIYTPTGAFSGIGFAIPSNQAKVFIGQSANMRQANFFSGAANNLVAGMPLTAMSPTTVMMQQVAQQGPPAAPVISPNAPVPGSHNDGRNQMNCASCHQFTGGAQMAAPVAMMMPAAAPAPAAPVISPNAPAPGSHNDGRNQMNCASCHQFTGGAQMAAPVAMMQQGQGMQVNPQQAQGQILAGVDVRGIGKALAARLEHPVGKGVFVVGITPNSPAEREGLRAGDIILKVDGRRLASPGALLEQVKDLQHGDAIRLTILRDGRRERLGFVIDKRWVMPQGMNGIAPGIPAAPKVPNEFSWKGIKIESFNPTQVNAVNVAAGKVPGAVVDEITPGSGAAQAGVLPGDVLVELNGLPVLTPGTLDEAIRAASQDKDNLVKLVRSGRELFVVL